MRLSSAKHPFFLAVSVSALVLIGTSARAILSGAITVVALEESEMVRSTAMIPTRDKMTTLVYGSMVSPVSDDDVSTNCTDYAGSAGSDSTGDGEDLTICHIPPGNPSNAHQITIGQAAVPAHLAHGDYVGTCNMPGSETSKSQNSGSNNSQSQSSGSKSSGSKSNIDTFGMLKNSASSGSKSAGSNSAGSTSASSTSAGSKSSDEEATVTVCHVPPGNPKNAHEITVGEPAVQAHLNHGDYIGPCVDEE